MATLADKLSQIEKTLKTEGVKQKAPNSKPRAPKVPAVARQAVAAGEDGASSGKGGKRERGGTFKGAATGFMPKALEPTPGMTAAEAREAPVGKVVKDVLECLRNNRGWMTAEELLAATKHDVHSPLVNQHLDSSERCLREGGQFKYKPRHANITGRQALLDHIRYHKAGTFIKDIDDSYPDVMSDIEALKAEHRIVTVEHPENKDCAIFWCDMMGVDVAQELVQFFHSAPAHVPDELQELQDSVVKAGLKSHMAAQPLRRPMTLLPKERKRKARAQRLNLEKATNKHLPEMLIKHQNAASIDNKGGH